MLSPKEVALMYVTNFQADLIRALQNDDLDTVFELLKTPIVKPNKSDRDNLTVQDLEGLDLSEILDVVRNTFRLDENRGYYEVRIEKKWKGETVQTVVLPVNFYDWLDNTYNIEDCKNGTAIMTDNIASDFWLQINGAGNRVVKIWITQKHYSV